MAPIPLAMWNTMRYDIMRADEAITRLPFCNLQNHALDSCGSPRAWPKWEAVGPPLPLTVAPTEGGECSHFLAWLRSKPPLDLAEWEDLIKTPGDLWSGVR